MRIPSLDLRIDSSSPRRLGFVSLREVRNPVLLPTGRFASMRLPSCVALGSPSIHPFIMELLHHLNIAPRQLMPNSWRIIISCMVIWTIIADGDMITLNELVHLYRLKKSKEFGYYELIPWHRRSWLIVDLPLSFRYWKLRYFFMSGNG